jgi:hypothetical protein
MTNGSCDQAGQEDVDDGTTSELALEERDAALASRTYAYARSFPSLRLSPRLSMGGRVVCAGSSRRRGRRFGVCDRGVVMSR